MRLTDLIIGQSAVIKGIDDKCINKTRLTELGFTENTNIIPLHKDFNGSITAYLIKGAVIAIRKDDAKNINIYLREEQ